MPRQWKKYKQHNFAAVCLLFIACQVYYGLYAKHGTANEAQVDTLVAFEDTRSKLPIIINNNHAERSTANIDIAVKTLQKQQQERIKSDPLDVIPDMPVECEGKERLWEIILSLRESISKDLVVDSYAEQCTTMPYWNDISDLYGNKPVVIGLDSCDEYRRINDQHKYKPRLKIAGLYNTGTNAFARMLDRNLVPHKRYGRKGRPLAKPTPFDQVPWGKHTLATYRGKLIAEGERDDIPLESILPVVIIRDPYFWMVSMCKMPYDVTWNYADNDHCPMLVPTDSDRKAGATSPRVYVSPHAAKYSIHDDFDSLAHLWSTWYMQYVIGGSAYPRLIIRYEDILYHAESVTKLVADCGGWNLTLPFKYRIKKSKNHGSSSDLMTALRKYGSDHSRYIGMTTDDLAYAAYNLNSTLMTLFRYKVHT